VRDARDASFESDFDHDLGVGPESPRPGEDQDGESFGLSVFQRTGAPVHRTYFTAGSLVAAARRVRALAGSAADLAGGRRTCEAARNVVTVPGKVGGAPLRAGFRESFGRAAPIA